MVGFIGIEAEDRHAENAKWQGATLAVTGSCEEERTCSSTTEEQGGEHWVKSY